MSPVRIFMAAALAAVAPAQPAVAPTSQPAAPAKTCVPPTAMPPVTSNAPHSTYYSDARPPARFAGHRTCVTVQFESPVEVQRICIAGGTVSPPPGLQIVACFLDDPQDGGFKIVMPNPCIYTDRDAYAHLLCHETGHVNGWPVTHGD